MNLLLFVCGEHDVKNSFPVLIRAQVATVCLSVTVQYQRNRIPRSRSIDCPSCWALKLYCKLKNIFDQKTVKKNKEMLWSIDICVFCHPDRRGSVFYQNEIAVFIENNKCIINENLDPKLV